MTWLEDKKEELRAINGLDPVEELLTQIGVMGQSHNLLIETNKKLRDRIRELENERDS